MRRPLVAVALAFSSLFVAERVRAEDRPPVIAVFEIIDSTNRPKRLPAGLTDYLRVKLAETRLVKVVDKGDQEAQLKKLIKAEKKSSYKTCVDEGCQIPLGKELAADKILRGKITRFGKSYVLAVEMIDLATGASAGAASDKNDGTEEGLMGSVEKVAAALSAGFQDRAAEQAKLDQEARAREDAQKAEQTKAQQVAQNTALTQQPTTAKVVIDDGPSGLEWTMIIGGWSVFAVAYIGDIMINLLSNNVLNTYYAFFPVGGPILIEMVNRSNPEGDSNPLNFVAAGVQLVGAVVAIFGHVLAATPDAQPAVQSGAATAAEFRVFVGPGTLGIAGTF